MDTPTRTTNIPAVSALDEFVGNVTIDGVQRTRRQSVENVARQLSGTAPLRYLSGVAPIFKTEAELLAASIADKVAAWVIDDPDVSKNGIWGGTGTAWEWALPLPYEIVPGIDAGTGTANAIQITTRVPVTDGMMVVFGLFRDTTGSPVTLSINGGSAVTLITNRGNAASALTEGMSVFGFARLSESVFRLMGDEDVSALVAQAEEARDAAIAARVAAEAAASGIARYAALSDAMAATVGLAVNTILLNGYHTESDGGGFTAYRKPAPEAAVPGDFFTNGGTVRWGIADRELHVRMFGAIGDFEPVTRVGSDDTDALAAAYDAARVLKRRLLFDAGVFRHVGELNVGGVISVGNGSRVSQIYYELDNTMAGGRVETIGGAAVDVGHMVYLTVPLGNDDGEFGSGWTVGRYFTNGEPISSGGFFFNRAGVYKAPGSPYSPAHGFNCMGRVSKVFGFDCEVEGFAGAAVHCHWGANGVGIDNPIVATYHPNNIHFQGMTVSGVGRVYTLSSCFNISISGIKGTANRVGDLLPGDETNFYAIADEKPLVGSNIHISDLVVAGIIDISSGSESDGALKVVSLGTSRADTDVETGQATRRLLSWKGIVIENGKLTGADDVSRAIDITGAVGQGILRNIDVSEISRKTLGMRIVDNRGDWEIDNISLGSKLGLEWLRSWGVRCTNMKFKMADRTGLTGDLFAVRVDRDATGSSAATQFSATLAANKTAGATSITLSTALAAVLNPGDTIVVNGNNATVAGTRQIRSTETVIPIAAAAWTATTGDAVTCDQRSVVINQKAKYDLYDFGVGMSGPRYIDFLESEFTDIAKQGISGTAKGGRIHGARFVRGGQHRLTEAGYASRNILLTAGTENVSIGGCGFGIDATHIDIGVVISGDTGNMRVRDNGFGTFITSEATFSAQTTGRTTAGQLNVYADNYKYAGGAIS